MMSDSVRVAQGFISLYAWAYFFFFFLYTGGFLEREKKHVRVYMRFETEEKMKK